MNGTQLRVDRLGQPCEAVLEPDAATRAAIARRLGLIELPSLRCRFRLAAARADTVTAEGELEAEVVQLDVLTQEPFAAPVHEAFRLRFMPEETIDEVLDPDDPVDDVGYAGGTIDLAEAMCEQLALALDPYPRQSQPDDA